MAAPDFERTRALLVETEDTEVARVVRILDAVFRSAKFRPLAETVEREGELVKAVFETFPTPFARKFAGWFDLDDELNTTFQQLAEDIADPGGRDRIEQRARLRFRNSLLEIETCWRQIVHFMPFILMATLRRMNDDTLRQYAGEELAKALHYYNTFYGRYDQERQREADQQHLLVYLVRLFRKLRRSAGLDEAAIFATAIGRTASGFTDLVPERFDASMRLLQQVRNRILHGRVADRVPASTLAAMNGLVKWCFLEVIAILAPICRTYSLNYVVELTIQAEDAEAETLDFAGASGPHEARYRVSTQPQVEEFAFTRHRLYLILRAKRLGEGTGEMLEPRDYLALTPFMITEWSRTARRDSPLERQRLLFALQQYLEPLRRLLFSDLGGSGDSPRPTDANDWEANQLLDQIQWFKERIGQLIAKVSIKTGAQIDLPSVRAQLWRISKEHLAPLMDVRLYDETGAAIPGAIKRELKSVYDEDLYVEPREGTCVAAFLSSDRRALLLVGGSGSGKSNLLVHHYLERLRHGTPCVFLSGRRFDAPVFRDVLVSRLVGQITGDWTALADLDAFLEEHGETLTIFVDALNEYSGTPGPLQLLADMISAVHGEPALRRCRIVATCRSETWSRYRQEFGNDRPLDPTIFFSVDGDAVRVGDFADPELRRKLYERYCRYFDLSPRSYDDLTAPVRTLIAQPFMTAIVADTYSNRGPADDAPRRSIPADLDYFSIFETLTERKAGDARVLIPADEMLLRERLPGAIASFCKILAEMIYGRLMEGDPDAESGSGLDAVPLDAIDKRPSLQEFVQRRGAISVIEVALQIGLIEQLRISQRDWEGRLAPSAAVAFFHDQYTQYWLASAYQQPILGWLDGKRLASATALDDLVGGIGNIVTRATHAPILAGALDHWLQKNLVIFHRRKLDPVVPLLDRMAAHASAAVRYQVVVTLSHLILRGFLTPQEVFDPIFRTGSAALREEMVSAFVEFWPALPPLAVQAFLDACHPDRDRASVERLGDVFVLHLLQQPALVVEYLDKAVIPLSWSNVTEPVRLRRQSWFILQFAVFGVMTSFDAPDRIAAIRTFFRAKYRVIIDLVTGSRRRSGLASVVLGAARVLMFRLLENFGVQQWNKYIGYLEESGNSRFFTQLDGVVQRDLLHELLPYLIELHNGEYQRLSLAPGSAFRDLLLRMLDFRVMSVIGYNALLCLPSVLLRQPWSTTEAFVMELIERRSPSAVFYGNLLLANLSYSDPKLAPSCLALMRDRIVPFLLRNGLPCDWTIAFCITMLDVERLWPIQEAILEQLFDAADAAGDFAACERLGEFLYKACYCHDIRLGRRMVERLLDDPERFLGARWRPATLMVLAAMLTRSPATLHAILRAAGAAESLVGESRPKCTPTLVGQSRLFPFQADINRFVAWLYVDEPRMRHAVVKYFIGSLACGTSIEDFAAGVRQTVVALLTVFFGDAPEKAPQGRLSLPEISAAVAGARRGRRRKLAGSERGDEGRL